LNKVSKSRIKACFEQCKNNHKKALIPYITAGDPQPDYTISMMHSMVEAGADILELGVPFSDPGAEGPVIQLAMERALAHDVSLHNVLAMVAEFRTKNSNTPVLLMGYLNPIEIMGYEAFSQQASESGVDAVLIVDMPPEEAGDLLNSLRKYGLDMIFLVAPTTELTRIKAITAVASGFIYYVSLKGVTGAGHLDTEGVKAHVARIQSVTSLPVVVGFGIKDASTAAQIAYIADGAVVGSAIVRLVAEHADSLVSTSKAISGLLSEMRQAMDAV
jgi:tryptophan synthase alpha chain